MSIVLIDATSDSITVSWPEASGQRNKTIRYILQYKRGKATTTTAKSKGPTGGNGMVVDDADTTDTNDANHDNNNHNNEFKLLSDSLTTTQARKKNLTDRQGRGFFFRVAVATGTTPQHNPSGTTTAHCDSSSSSSYYSWISHETPLRLLTCDQERERLPAPRVTLGGSNASLRIVWTTPTLNATTLAAVPTATSTILYELQMRENAPGVAWTTIADQFRGMQVRKKNLTSPLGYQFRVRPITTTAVSESSSNNGNNSSRSASTSPNYCYAFSPPSDPFVALGYSHGLQQLFRLLKNGTLLLPSPSSQQKRKQQSNHALGAVVDLLGGKEFILLYVSAHWCGPCRQFTPQLIQWYNTQTLHRGTDGPAQNPNSSPVEVVFVSADHDAQSFATYYQTMPWPAVDYADTEFRDQLMAYLSVSGIPRLVVLDGRTGNIVQANAVGQPLDVDQWRRQLAVKK